MKNKFWFFLLSFIIIISFSYTVSAQGINIGHYVTARGRVIPSESSVKSSKDKVNVKIISGKYKGKILTVDTFSQFDSTGDGGKSITVKPNDTVYVEIHENKSGTISNVFIFDFFRLFRLFITFLIFVILLLAIGGRKGFSSILTLAFTTFTIIKIIIPCIQLGINSLLVTVISCIALLILNNLIIYGINKKTLASIIGTVSGMAASIFFMLIIGYSFKITGIGDDDAETLISLFPNSHIYFKDLLFSAILLSSLGALIDTGISLSSSMSELIKNNPDITKKELIKSGMNIGKDIIGAMTTTLILAYTGSSLVLLLITISSYKMSLFQIINENIICSEIFKALIGSIGLILTVPFTIFAMAELTFMKKSKKLS
ncbi:MAG: YibE/F family protein [Clostridium sp.]|nr:YibE/F family protein [Clostridium sp.]